MRVNQTIAAAVLASVVAVGCTDAFTPENVAGTYELTSIDGNAIPWTQPTAPDSVTIVTVESGRLTLSADATWLISLTASTFDGDTTVTSTVTGSGTYTLTEPNTIELADEGDVTIEGTLEGRRITLDVFGIALVFEK